MSFQITITDAGRAALLNAQSNGTESVILAEVGISDHVFTPDPLMTTLPGELKRLSTIAGEAQDAHTLHITVLDESNATYSVHSFGLFLDDGTLFGVYAQADPLLEKGPQTILLMALDIAIESADVSAITFGDTTFINPPATTERAGVVELATPAQTVTGTNHNRATTPAGVAAALSAFTKPFTAAEKSKLSGIETGATKNATDAQLRDRSTHTGTQAISTVSGLSAALNSKAEANDPRLTDSRGWSAATVSKADAEAGTSTARRAWTAQRVRQAVVAWWNSSAAKTKLDGIAAGATKNATDAQLRDRSTHTGTQDVSTINGLRTAATRDVGTSLGNVMEVGAFGLGPGTMARTIPLDSKTEVISYKDENNQGLPGSGVYSDRSAVLKLNMGGHLGFLQICSDGPYWAWGYQPTEVPTFRKLIDTSQIGTGSSQFRTNAQNDARYLTPAGVIVMWSGAINNIPAGWALCDGTNGTPDLRDRFIVGAGSTYTAGAKGGAASATTNSSGAHTHPISVTVNNHTLTTAQIASHSHSSTINVTNRSGAGRGTQKIPEPGTGTSGEPLVTWNSNSAGGGSAHSHGASGSSSSSGAHTHTVSTLPPYYALAFIMKL